MDLSFQEKSLWLVFWGLIVVFATYFALVLPAEAADVGTADLVRFAAVVVLLVVIQTVGHILLAILDRRHGADERDKLIGLKSTRNGSYVLAAGVFLSLSAAVLTEGNFIFTHVLLGFWVIAQLVEIGSQLILYRRGA